MSAIQPDVPSMQSKEYLTGYAAGWRTFFQSVVPEGVSMAEKEAIRDACSGLVEIPVFVSDQDMSFDVYEVAPLSQERPGSDS
jgi:hypothetical protein